MLNFFQKADEYACFVTISSNTVQQENTWNDQREFQ